MEDSIAYHVRRYNYMLGFFLFGIVYCNSVYTAKIARICLIQDAMFSFVGRRVSGLWQRKLGVQTVLTNN